MEHRRSTGTETKKPEMINYEIKDYIITENTKHCVTDPGP